jgi:HAD superfamily hydrolase (TIGR01509 family)
MTALPRPLGGVLFDLDGTLVDTEHLHYQSTEEVLGGFGHHLPLAEFNRYIGWAERPFWVSLSARFGLAPAPDELAQLRSKALVRLLLASPLEPLPGVREMLAFLSERQVPCAIASSSLRAQIAATVTSARLGISTWASGHDDVARGKPNPDVYLEAARRLGVEPQTCLAIEDSSTGVASARAAGAFVVAIQCPSHPDLNLDAAHLRLGSMTELVELLRSGG